MHTLGLEFRERAEVDELVLEGQHLAAFRKGRECFGVAPVALEQRRAHFGGGLPGRPEAEQTQIE